MDDVSMTLKLDINPFLLLKIYSDVNLFMIKL